MNRNCVTFVLESRKLSVRDARADLWKNFHFLLLLSAVFSKFCIMNTYYIPCSSI